MEFEVGQQFLVPSDGATREIISVTRTKYKPIRVTDVVLRCIDCKIISKDLSVDIETMEHRLKWKIYIFLTHEQAG